MKYHHRDAIYEISVYNTDHVSNGIKTIYVDNDLMHSNDVPLEETGEHKVDVIM